MVERKLLTLAGVVGILACGACFLPPLAQHAPPPPPPPPVRIELVGIQSIRVEVANASPSHHLDPAVLAQKIAETINLQSWRTKIHAYVGKEAGNGDAVLEVTVLSETVEAATPAKIKSITFLINDSATLTRANGALVWQETEAGSSVFRNLVEGDPADAWKLPGLVDGVDRALSHRLVFRMISGR